MEDQTIDIKQEILCKSCGSSNIEEGYAYPLCRSCRENLVHRPVPVQIKLVALGVLVVLIFALFRFPTVLSTAIAFERGQVAERNIKYMTALTDYRQVIKDMPDSKLALSRSFIVEYRSGHIEEAFKTLDLLKDKTYSDHESELLNEVNQTIREMDSFYIPERPLMGLMKKINNASWEEKLQSMQAYLQSNPNSVFAGIYTADVLYELKRYDEAKALMSNIVKANNYMPGYLFMAAVCREQKDYDQGLDYCRKTLVNNPEYAEAYSSMAKIELKRKHNQEGLQMAQKAYQLDAGDPYILSNLALAYHFNHMNTQRDGIYRQLCNPKYNAPDRKFLDDVFSGRLSWQD